MFPKRLPLFLLATLVCTVSFAQHNPYEYYLGGESSQSIESIRADQDLTLFYSPIEAGGDIFTRMSEYNFSAVRYSRRGYDMRMEQAFLGNLNLSNPLTDYADYALLSAIKRSRIPRISSGGLAHANGNHSSVSGTELLLPDPRMMAPVNRISAFGYTRNGRYGGNFAGTTHFSGNFSAAYNVYARGGDDANIDGVYTRELSFALLPQFRFDGPHSITVGLFMNNSERGLRSSATKEAFELTGDNYYNPSWGYFDGDKRNARVRKERPIMGMLAYEALFRTTKLNVSVSYTDSRRAYSSLSWFDAATPYPDYYRDMPSYLGETPAGNAVRDKWLAGDASVTQINWDRICEVNAFAGQMPVEQGGARYLLEDRVEHTKNFQAAVTGRTAIDAYSSFDYGVRLRKDGVRFFKKAKDMLGGAPFLNADNYLADTTRYDGKWLNDMRNPAGLVDKGEIFGYDYYMRLEHAEVFGGYEYMSDRFRFNASAGLGLNKVWREGNFEKELHPGPASYGSSDGISLDTYTAKVSASYSFSPQHILRVTGMAASQLPSAGNMFLSPQQSNKIIDDGKAISILAAEAEYIMNFNSFGLKLAGFYSGTSDETAVYSYYDDIEATYSDMVLSGIDKNFYGVELGIQVDFTSRLSLTVAASAGDYTYASDPAVNIYEDATLRQYVINSKSYLEGYRIGNTPQRVVSAELKYNMYGFIASLTFNYMGDRYVTANPLRRMARAYDLADSPERFSEFVAQEKLPHATTVDLFLLKSFDFRRGGITFMLSVNNLLNNQEIVYSGYEQMRIMRRNAGAARQYVPFDSKYLYSHPRSFYLSATYRF